MTRGHTLIELLVTLAVAAILLGIAVPTLRQLGADATLRAHSALFTQAVHTTRLLAVTARRPVTLCALDNDNRCSGHWSDDLSLFYDEDRDGVLAQERDRLAMVVIPGPDRVDVDWQGFGERRFLNARANGSWRQNGRFRFCLPARAEGREVVINVTGRARGQSARCR